MFKLNVKKWNEDRLALEKLQKEETRDWAWHIHAEKLTVLYSIRAMSRNKVHRTKAALSHYEAQTLGALSGYNYDDFCIANGRIVLDLNMDHQKAFLKDKWKAYEAVEEEKPWGHNWETIKATREPLNEGE